MTPDLLHVDHDHLASAADVWRTQVEVLGAVVAALERADASVLGARAAPSAARLLARWRAHTTAMVAGAEAHAGALIGTSGAVGGADDATWVALRRLLPPTGGGR